MSVNLEKRLAFDASAYEGEELPLPHSVYPHNPGQLYDCPACETECWCTGRPGDTQCIFCASLEGEA